MAKFANLHAGASVSLPFGKKIEVESWAAIHTETADVPYVLSAFWMNWKPTASWKISFGNHATPVSEFRPHPVSSDGQFETWTEALLPGTATGIKAAYIKNNFHTKLGAFYRNGDVAEISGKVVYGKIGFGVYGRDNGAYGGALTCDFTHVYSILSVSDKNAGNFTSIKTKYFNLYSDAGIDRVSRKLVRGEWGIIKNFSLKKYSGLVALGFQNESHTINTYLFIHL